MTALAYRNWVPADSEKFVQAIARETSGQTSAAIAAAIDRGIALNRTIHWDDCINLNPAANVMNPKAEAALASGLGSRPSLGYPGDKYEMGLEGIERIEVIAAELAAEIFAARYAEIRVGSGALANLYAICRKHFPESHRIELIDVLKDPMRALADEILVTPTVVKLSPAPEQQIIGNLSEEEEVLRALGLPQKEVG